MLTLGQEFAGIYNVCHLFWSSYFVVIRCLLNLTMQIVEEQLLKDGSIQNQLQPPTKPAKTMYRFVRYLHTWRSVILRDYHFENRPEKSVLISDVYRRTWPKHIK